MSSSKLVRLCGLAIVVSGVLYVITSLTDIFLDLIPEAPPAAFYLEGAIGMFAAPLEVLGLVGLYARRPQALGTFGLIAFLVTFFGAALAAGAAWYVAFGRPSLALLNVQLLQVLEIDRPGPYAFAEALTFLLYYLGWVLFGVAVLQGRLYPRLAVILLIVVALLSGAWNVLLNLMLGPLNPGSILPYASAVINILFNGILAWLGFALWTGRGVPEASRTTEVGRPS